MRQAGFFTAVVAAALFSVHFSSSIYANGGGSDEIREPELARELRVRVDSDQAAREEFFAFASKHKMLNFDGDLTKFDPKISEKYTALMERMTNEDARNLIWLKEAVEKHGWPGKSLVGSAGAQNAWLLVQHADSDRDFQQQCLSKMEALPKGEVTPSNIAYLTDRILIGTGNKQKYGTQAIIKDGKLTPSPIEDEEHVDERRKEIGLGTLAEYLVTMAKAYGISEKPDPKRGNKDE